MAVPQMLGAIMGGAKPKGDARRAAKPKTKAKGGHRVTHGEKSLVSHVQQHGELASGQLPKPPTDRQLMKESARHTARRATADWVEGRISTREHNAIHARAEHVRRGRHPKDF